MIGYWKKFAKKCYRRPTGDLVWRYVVEPISLPLIRLLLFTPVTANQISLFALLISFISILLIAFGNSKLALIGFFGLLLFLFLDSIDGAIARCKKQTSIFGQYLDGLCHDLISPSVFLGIGINLFRESNKPLFLYLGIFIMFSSFVMNILRLDKYKVLLLHSSKNNNVIKISSSRYTSKSKGFTNLITSPIHFLNSNGHLFTLLFFLNIFNLLAYALIFYSIFHFVLFILKVYLELKEGFKPYGLK